MFFLIVLIIELVWRCYLLLTLTPYKLHVEVGFFRSWQTEKG